MKLTKAVGVMAAMTGLSALAPLSEASEIRELDYVEATGTQWVDTGVVGKSGLKAEIRVQWINISSDSTMLSSRASAATSSRVNFCNTSDSSIGYGHGEFNYAKIHNGSVDFGCKWELDRIYTVVVELADPSGGAKSSFTVDGVDVNVREAAAGVNTGCNLAIFGNNIAGSVSGLAKARCYGLKIWEGEELKRDFTPVLADSRAGFRDEVSGELFFSATDTDLVAGTFADEPDGYVDYIESFGTECIDLEVVGKTGVTLESRMAWMTVPGDGSYVAARDGDSVRFYALHYYGSTTLGYGSYYQSGTTASSGEIYDIRTELKQGRQTLSVNGEVTYENNIDSTVDTGLNLYLFGCNKNGVLNYASRCRCYSLKLWEGETLVRDFRPCLKMGEACLYDQVSRRIFRANKKTLACGVLPEKGRPDYFVDYIESKGNSYVDTGVRAASDIRATGTFNMTQVRDANEELFVYLEKPLSREERTILGTVKAGSDSGRFYMIHESGDCLWTGYGANGVYPKIPDVNQSYHLRTDVHTFDITLANGCQSATFNDVKLTMPDPLGARAESVDSERTLFLFACNSGGRGVCYQSNARCYGLKLWKDSKLVRDFRPCVKGGRAGLYDEVNDEVVYPSIPLDETCIGAPILTPDMKPAKILEYVETDGTQWYDTEVIGRVGTSMRCRVSWLNENDECLLGARSTDGDTRFYMCHKAYSWLSYGFEAFANLPVPSEKGRVFRIRTSFAANRQTVEIDGVTVLDQAKESTLDTKLPMCLFAANVNGTVSYKSMVRLYEMRIYQDGRIVRQYVPVLLECGANALYDMIEGKTLSPKGGNLLKWGPVVMDYEGRPGFAVQLR